MSSEARRSDYSPAQLNPDQVRDLLESAATEFPAAPYFDVSSNEPRNDDTRRKFAERLREMFEVRLTDAVERMWQLPPVILQRPNDEYIRLLVEARELFVAGYFYSCVAMCGIVGERLLKDLLRGSLMVAEESGARRPSDEAFDQLERVDVRALTQFLNRAGLLDDKSQKAALNLVELRNQYAHARGKQPQADALGSIGSLHSLLEGTVSVLKDYEIVNGNLSPRKGRVSSSPE